MKTVKIYFVDFWDGFDPNNNFFTRLLSVKYDLVIDPVSHLISINIQML